MKSNTDKIEVSRTNCSAVTLTVGIAITSTLTAQTTVVSPDGDPFVVSETVVTGTKSERPLSDVPVRTEVVTAREIEMANVTKLADIMEYQNGVRVESNCANCNTSEIRMLGLQQRYLSLLTDGQATFSGLAGVYGIEQIPTGILDCIEVVKGGASALYGSNAVAGVVNLIPRDPQENRFTLEVTPGWMKGDVSGDRWNTDTSVVGEWINDDGSFGIIGYGLQSYVAGVDINGDDFTEISRRDLYGAGVRAVWLPTPDLKISFDYMHTNEDRRGGEDGDALDIAAHETLVTEELESVRNVGTLTLKHEVTADFDYQASASLAHTDRDSYYGGISALGYAEPGSVDFDQAVIDRLVGRFPQYAGDFADAGGAFYNPAWTPDLGYGTTDNLLFNLDTSAIYAINEDHTLTAGYQYRHESLEDSSGLGRSVDDSYINHGVFIQDEWFINDYLEVVYGLRADKHSKVSDAIFSPRFSFKFSPTHNFDLRGSVATGFRAPELFDEDLHISNVGGELEVVRLADDLEEEKSVTFSLSPNWRIDDHWELEGSVFYTRLTDTFFNDISSDDPSTPGIVESTKINSGDAKVYGMELNLIHRMGHVTSEIGYVEQRSRYSESQLLLGEPGDPIDNAIMSRNFEKTPNRYGLIKVGYDDGTFAAFVAGKLTGPMEVPHVVSDSQSGELIGNQLEKTGYFFTVDLGASYAWDFGDSSTLTLQAGVKNVFNDFQDDLDEGTFRDPSYTYGPRFSRTVYAGAKYEF
ncbi:MAG: TonB-dependent receptor [Verrucomicrobiota bacterium JB023]|nr:TonB-dependent receptor [Verrucomicrobiota bacterium JB023]